METILSEKVVLEAIAVGVCVCLAIVRMMIRGSMDETEQCRDTAVYTHHVRKDIPVRTADSIRGSETLLGMMTNSRMLVIHPSSVLAEKTIMHTALSIEEVKRIRDRTISGPEPRGSFRIRGADYRTDANMVAERWGRTAGARRPKCTNANLHQDPDRQDNHDKG